LYLLVGKSEYSTVVDSCSFDFPFFFKRSAHSIFDPLVYKVNWFIYEWCTSRLVYVLTRVIPLDSLIFLEWRPEKAPNPFN
jgi:hypothetical protein